MDKDIKILGLVFGCLIILFFISGNITGSWLWFGEGPSSEELKEPATFRYIKTNGELEEAEEKEELAFEEVQFAELGDERNCIKICGADLDVVYSEGTVTCDCGDGSYARCSWTDDCGACCGHVQ